MRTFFYSRWLLVLGLLVILGAGPVRQVQAADPPGQPPHPRLQNPQLAPKAARIVEQVALRYDPDMTPQARDRDFLNKIALAKHLLSLTNLEDLREQTLALLPDRTDPSWETVRCLRWPQGDRVGVVLSVPVWVASQAKRVPAFAGYAKKWQTVALCEPRPSCYVWFDGQLADINNRAHYRPERTLVEVNSRFAPLAGLFLEYIFREGWYDLNKRVPILALRAGEDCWAVSPYGGPVTAECLTYPDKTGCSMDGVVVQCYFDNMAELHHGGHVHVSNHRLGLAMDVNDFNFKGAVDGSPNPVSASLRQYDRDAMHKLDARNLPAWVYTAGKWVGLRIPQIWIYGNYKTDWAHFDVGTKNSAEGLAH